MISQSTKGAGSGGREKTAKHGGWGTHRQLKRHRKPKNIGFPAPPNTQNTPTSQVERGRSNPPTNHTPRRANQTSTTITNLTQKKLSEMGNLDRTSSPVPPIPGPRTGAPQPCSKCRLYLRPAASAALLSASRSLACHTSCRATTSQPLLVRGMGRWGVSARADSMQQAAVM